MKKTLIFTFVLLTMISFTSLAQQYRSSMKQEDREKLESAKIAYITNRLTLTSSQAKEFWPLYNEFERKKFEARTKARREGYRMTNRGQNDLTEAQATEILEIHIKAREEDVAIEKEYLSKFQNIISDGQILKLLTIDESFLRNYLMRELRGDKDGDRRSNDSSNK
ncbi:hypothetical protein [Peijinzhouia sedimentorum]